MEVTLEPGMAIDGTGREIVVPAPVLLSKTDFIQVNGASPQAGAFYPVLLHGIDSDAPAPPLAIGACGPASQPTRTLEDRSGSPSAGSAPNFSSTSHRYRTLAPALDPLPGGHGRSWPVPCSGTARTRGSPTASGTGRRYAGVKADTVAARSGTLALRAQPSPAPGQPALLVGGDPPALTFGLYKGGNAVDPRLTVSAQGDVIATGTIKGALTQGEIRVQSGTATDGVIIPLPPGITEDQVARGAVILHLHLTPHTPQSTAQGAGTCRSNAMWTPTAGSNAWCRSRLPMDRSSKQPGAADYLMVATVGPASGANP